jgi:hypothetical protein
MEIASNETIKQAVMAGLGVSFLSLHTIGLELRSGLIRVLDIDGTPLMRTWNIVHLQSRVLSPAAEAFRYFIIEHGEASLERTSRAWRRIASPAARKAAPTSATVMRYHIVSLPRPRVLPLECRTCPCRAPCEVRVPSTTASSTCFGLDGADGDASLRDCHGGFRHVPSAWEPRVERQRCRIACGPGSPSAAGHPCARADVRWLSARALLASCEMRADAVAALPLDDVAAVMGSLYVIEGSALGGRVIGPQTREDARSRPGTAEATTFEGFGDATGAMWRDFRLTASEEIGDSPHAIDAGVRDGARQHLRRDDRHLRRSCHTR